MSHPFDIVGYTADADTYCVKGAKEKYDLVGNNLGRTPVYDGEGNQVLPIFADAEFDYPVGCAVCSEYIETKLTTDGFTNAMEMVEDALRKRTFNEFLWAVALDLLWMGPNDAQMRTLDRYIAFCEVFHND